jgi:uncharacterized membrane protein YhhN
MILVIILLIGDKESFFMGLYIFLIILGVVSLIYLITLFFKESLLQFILKGCLVPLILAVYISVAEVRLWQVILALVFGWIGDVLLLKTSNILRFKLGLVSFLIGHVLYIIALFKYAHPLNIPVLIISAAVAACYGVFIFRVIHSPHEMRIPVMAYEVILLTMAVFALQFFLAQGRMLGAFVFIGSICFVASDTMLTLLTFRKINLYVLVMITYIAAQLLITLGFGLMKV